MAFATHITLTLDYIPNRFGRDAPLPCILSLLPPLLKESAMQRIVISLATVPAMLVLFASVVQAQTADDEPLTWTEMEELLAGRPGFHIDYDYSGRLPTRAEALEAIRLLENIAVTITASERTRRTTSRLSQRRPKRRPCGRPHGQRARRPSRSAYWAARFGSDRPRARPGWKYGMNYLGRDDPYHRRERGR